MEVVDTKFVLNKTINNSLKCELVSYPKWIKFLGRKEFKDKKAARKDVRIVRFYFLAKKGGLADFEFNSIHVFENGMENSLSRNEKVLVLPGNELRLKVLPVLTEKVSRATYCHGKLVKRSRSINSYSGIEINYQKFQPMTDDFVELINGLSGGSGMVVYETLRSQLIHAGLLNESYGMGDFGTELLTKNRDKILAAIKKAENHSTVP